MQTKIQFKNRLLHVSAVSFSLILLLLLLETSIAVTAVSTNHRIHSHIQGSQKPTTIAGAGTPLPPILPPLQKPKCVFCSKTEDMNAAPKRWVFTDSDWERGEWQIVPNPFFLDESDGPRAPVSAQDDDQFGQANIPSRILVEWRALRRTYQGACKSSSHDFTTIQLLNMEVHCLLAVKTYLKTQFVKIMPQRGSTNVLMHARTTSNTAQSAEEIVVLETASTYRRRSASTRTPKVQNRPTLSRDDRQRDKRLRKEVKKFLDVVTDVCIMNYNCFRKAFRMSTEGVRVDLDKVRREKDKNESMQNNANKIFKQEFQTVWQTALPSVSHR